jgi:hypothetical protein
MRPHYSSIPNMQTIMKAAAVIALVMVWILIDKGNALGQSARQATEAVGEQDTPSQLSRFGDPDGETGDGSDDTDGDFNIFPNPVDDDAVFDFEFTVRKGMPYEVTDALGRLVQSGTFEADLQQQRIDMSGYRPGLYMVRVNVAGRAIVKRIYKR